MHRDSPTRLLSLLILDMSTEEFPAPADWPAATTVTCTVCNRTCYTTVLERGSAVATYVCEEQHDTHYAAIRNEKTGEWEFGEVPF